MKNYLSNPVQRQKFRLLLFDGLIVLIVFIISYSIRIGLYEGENLSSLFSRMSWLVVIGIVIHLLTFYLFGLYDFHSFFNRKVLLINIFFSVSTATIFIVLFSFAFPESRIGRLLTIIQYALMNIALYTWRRIYSERRFQDGYRDVIIVGWNSLVDKIAHYLGYEKSGYSLRSFVIPPQVRPQKAVRNPIMVFESLDEALASTDAATLVITKELLNVKEFSSRVLDLKFLGKAVYTGPAFYEHIFGKVPVSEISESWLLYGFREGTIQSVVHKKFKRFLDLVLSMAVLLVGCPIFLIVALMIKLESRGPIFFRQERLGLNERSFDMLKFRTMIKNAEQEKGPCWASENDIRFTRIGKVLRKMRLDEFPQFINVIKGEMSLVGPRPIRRHFADIFIGKFPFYRLRFKVKPGITGWAQVNMDYVNTEKDQYEKLEYEFYYIYHQSIFLDFFIILKTIQSMMKMRGR